MFTAINRDNNNNNNNSNNNNNNNNNNRYFEKEFHTFFKTIDLLHLNLRLLSIKKCNKSAVVENKATQDTSQKS